VAISFDDVAPRKAQPVGAAPMSSMNELRQAFEAMDTDRSGSLDRSEIRQLLVTTDPDGTQWSEESLNAAIADLDEDSDGLVSYEEFETWWRGLEKRSSTAALSPVEQALACGVLSSVQEYQASLRARR
jgi:hypothetical protein